MQGVLIAAGWQRLRSPDAVRPGPHPVCVCETVHRKMPGSGANMKQEVGLCLPEILGGT